MIVATRPAASVCLRLLGRIFTVVSSRVVPVARRRASVPRRFEGAVQRWGSSRVWVEALPASREPLGEWPLPPPMERGHAVVPAHARCRAVGGEHERLGVSVGAFADDSG